MKAVGDQDRTLSNPADKQNFIELIRELHTAFKPYGFVLSAVTSAGKPTIDRAYNLPEMSKYLDMINLMTYDFDGAWERQTGSKIILFSIFINFKSKIELTFDFLLKKS
jgi:chitinase